MFGLIGSGTQANRLIRIDTATAIGIEIGSLGRAGVLAVSLPVDSVAVGVEEQRTASLPTTFALEQNYPNPFNPSTKIVYRVASREFIELGVYDILGRKVVTLVNEVKQPGTYTVQWDASNIASGVYFYRLQAGQFSAVQKMLLMR